MRFKCSSRLRRDGADRFRGRERPDELEEGGTTPCGAEREEKGREEEEEANFQLPPPPPPLVLASLSSLISLEEKGIFFLHMSVESTKCDSSFHFQSTHASWPNHIVSSDMGNHSILFQVLLEGSEQADWFPPSIAKATQGSSTTVRRDRPRRREGVHAKEASENPSSWHARKTLSR